MNHSVKINGNYAEIDFTDRAAENLYAKADEDYEKWFEAARSGFDLPPTLWPAATDKLFGEIQEHYILSVINKNWYDEAEIGRLLKQHIREAWEQVE